MAAGLRFGVHSGQQYTDVSEVIALWRRAEELGYDWVSLFDHLRPAIGGAEGPCLEGTTLLAALATATSRVRCAILVSAVTWRHPAMAAAVAATLDRISGGRLEFGVGVGGYDGAYEQWGIAFPPYAERLIMVGEACQVMRSLWTEEVTTFTGRHYRLSAARLQPKPLQPHLPLVLGGAGPRFLRIAAEHADVWNSLGGNLDAFRLRHATLVEHCRSLGRDPDEIRPSITFRVVLGADRTDGARRRIERFAAMPRGSSDVSEYLQALTPAECVDELRGYVRAGAKDFLLGVRPPVDLRTVELFASDVIPALRA